MVLTQNKITNISIHHYQSSDAIDLRNLFYDTVHHINCHDYTSAQLNAWAPKAFDLTRWQQRLDQNKPFIAKIDHTIIGFIDLLPSGLIDHFFVHYQYQNKGVGRMLMEHLFKISKHNQINHPYSYVSITARPFFEYFGFNVIKSQQAQINGQVLTNFLMQRN